MSFTTKSLGLNEDCATEIFSYLPLRSLLSYGAASRGTLQSIDPYLNSIRKTIVRNVGLYRSVEMLSRVMKSGFLTGFEIEFGKDVAELRSALWMVSQPQNEEEPCNHHSGTTNETTTYLLLRQNENLKFHKSCRTLLSKILSLANDDCQSTMALDRYFGTIITTACLLGRGIHESPTELDWLCHIGSTANHHRWWMRLWMIIHSTVLRIRSPPEQHLSLLGITNGRCVDEQEEVRHDRGFFQCPTPNVVRALLDVLVTTVSCNSDTYDLTFRINDFGPLGPTFRGRDNHRTVIWNLHQAIGLLQQPLTVVRSEARSAATVAASAAILEEEHGLLENLYKVQREVFKSRPMTVSPPVVYLSKNS